MIALALPDPLYPTYILGGLLSLYHSISDT